MNKKCMNTAFTLAELLAVVIIVAILSSLGLGHYKRSVEQARFGEGLSVASALVEAVNQAYLEDHAEGAENAMKKRKIKTLNFGLPNPLECASKSDYCVAIPHFELQVEEVSNRAVVRAYRGKATGDDYTYYIQLQPMFASSNKDQIACVGNTNFCESMGYTNCASNFCTK